MNKRKSHPNLNYQIDTLQVITKTQLSLSQPNSPALPSEEKQEQLSQDDQGNGSDREDDPDETQVNEQIEEYNIRGVSEGEEELKVPDDLDLPLVPNRLSFTDKMSVQNKDGSFSSPLSTLKMKQRALKRLKSEEVDISPNRKTSILRQQTKVGPQSKYG